VEEYGYVASYAPRMSQGDHHHFLWLRPEAQIEVLTPISPHIELGTLDITMELSTQVEEQFYDTYLLNHSCPLRRILKTSGVEQIP